MHYANQNLLSIMHQSLGTQHVTADFFKRYARSPETRTFKNYFRKTNPFITYMRKRPHYSLSRYISLHKRKRYPILSNFTKQIKTTILSILQNLRPLKTQNKPILKIIKNDLTPLNTIINNQKIRTVEPKNKPISNPFSAIRPPNPKTAICSFSLYTGPVIDDNTPITKNTT